MIVSSSNSSSSRKQDRSDQESLVGLSPELHRRKSNSASKTTNARTRESFRGRSATASSKRAFAIAAQPPQSAPFLGYCGAATETMTSDIC